MINETDYTYNTLTKEQEEKIDAVFTDYDKPDMPGCTIGVIRDGGFIYKKNFGIANLDYDIPITSESKFYIASTSKQFTAACIILLQLDGMLNLDDEVRKHIPELPEYQKPIKIRHLLNHTSGLKDYYYLLVLSGVDQRLENHMCNSEAVKLICRQRELDFDPGEKYSYSNSGYVLLAEIVNRIAGKSINSFATEKIFKMLGMNDTFFNDDSHQIIKNRVISYLMESGKPLPCNSNLETVGDGGIITTMNDLIKWDRNFYDPVVGGQDMINQLLTKGILNSGEEIPYACGLLHLDHKGLPSVIHGGAMFGFRSEFVRFPGERTSVIILSNADDKRVGDLCFQIADILLIENGKEIQAQKDPAGVNIEAIELNNEELERFCGSYISNDNELVRKIILKGGSIYYYRDEKSETKLIPVKKNEFIMEGIPFETRLVFESGNKTIRFLEKGIETMSLRTYVPVETSKELVSRYTGCFYNEDLDITYELKTEDENLYLFIGRKEISELAPVVQDVFKAKKLESWGVKIVFDNDDSGRINGLSVSSGRAKGFKFYRVS